MLAIIFPALLIMTFTIVQAGLYYHAKQRAAAAADRAAAAAAAAGGDESVGEAAGLDFLVNMPLSEGAAPPEVVVDASSPPMVEATVSGPIDPIVPIGTWTVFATASARIEEFIPETER